jgi:hypothetical protein
LPPNPNLLLYLPEGLVFSSGTPNDGFNCGGFRGLKRHIYPVAFETTSSLVLEA